MNVENKTVMVTGAATGLGYKYAEILLQNGAKKVAVIDLPTSKGQEATATLENKFGKDRAVFFACDVSNNEDLEKTFKKVLDLFERLDILINNAGIVNDKQLERTINVNMKATINSTFLAIDHMGKHKGGKGGVIVNISSIVSLSTINIFLPIYCATKYAVLGFSQCMSNLYDTTGVRIVILCPGATSTDIFKDLRNKYLDIAVDYFDRLTNCLQPTDHVAAALLQLIQTGKNGAICVSEEKKPPYIVNFPHYSMCAVSL